MTCTKVEPIRHQRTKYRILNNKQPGSNNLDFRQKISIQKYFHLPPTDRSDVSHLERSRAAPISYTVVISGRCWARGRGSVHWRESATWKWHGSMKIIRSGGHAAAGGAIPHVAFVAYHFDNRPTVEKSSCPTRNHQFSLGVRPDFGRTEERRTQDRLDRFSFISFIIEFLLNFSSFMLYVR